MQTLSQKLIMNVPMTCTFIIWTNDMDKSTGTPPSLEKKKALPNCGNKDGNIINVLKNCISTPVATVLMCMKWLYPYVQVIGVWWFIFGSCTKCSVSIYLRVYISLRHFCTPRGMYSSIQPVCYFPCIKAQKTRLRCRFRPRTFVIYSFLTWMIRCELGTVKFSFLLP